MKARLAATMFILVAATAFGQTLRLGSPAPENSPWGRALIQIAAEWEEISGGRLRVQIFHNSVAGSEADMLRKMRLGQLQAVVVTSTGLSNFSDKSMTLSMPILIRTQDEYDYVFERVREEIEQDVREEGFHIMAWSFSGWAYFFGDRPLRTPSDLRSAKLAASPEEMKLVRAYQLMGYQPIPLSYSDRLTGLTNGMADAYLTVPILAAGFQWFGVTPYMTNIPISPMPAAVLMSNRAFSRLPRDVRDELQQAIERVTAGLDEQIIQLERESIDTMVRYGLQLVDPTPAERSAWIAELEDSYDVTLGLVFDEPFYRRIRNLLDGLRADQ